MASSQLQQIAHQPADTASAALQSAPSLSMLLAWLVGLPVQTWLAITSIAFIGLQAAYLIWKWRREARKGRK